MKRFAIVTLLLSSLATLPLGCSKGTPAPAEPAAVAKTDEKAPETAKPEDKPAEAKPAEAEAKPAEAEAEAKPAEAEAKPEASGVTKGWELFEDKDGTLTINAPGKPQTVPQEADTLLGRVTYMNHMFSIPDGMLMVAWADLPLKTEDITKEVEKNMFDGGRDGMMKAIKATLIKEEVIELDGFPGRAYLMELEVPGHGTAQNHVRTFLAGNRHYTLQGLGMGTGSKEAQVAFLDSFHITKVAAAAPAADEKAPAAPVAPGTIEAPAAPDAPAPVEKKAGE